MIGIIGAMDEEVEQIVAVMDIKKEETKACMTFKAGILAGKDVVIVRTDADNPAITSSYNIIQEMKYSSKEQAYVIVLSSQYAEYFNKTISINYNKRFDELIANEVKNRMLAFIKILIKTKYIKF